MINSYLLTPIEAATYLRMQEGTLKIWRKRKKGPAYYKLGGAIKYKIKDLDDFIEAQKVDNSKLPKEEFYFSSNADDDDLHLKFIEKKHEA